MHLLLCDISNLTVVSAVQPLTDVIDYITAGFTDWDLLSRPGRLFGELRRVTIWRRTAHCCAVNESLTKLLRDNKMR